MIISTNLLPVTIQIVNKSGFRTPFSHSRMPFPYCWNQAKHKFFVSPTYPKWLWMVVSGIQIATLLMQATLKKRSSDHCAFWKTILILHLDGVYFLFATCITPFHRFKSTAVCEYLNNLILFEQRHVNESRRKQWQTTQTKLMSILAIFFDFSCRMVTLLIPTTAFVLPNSPWNM